MIIDNPRPGHISALRRIWKQAFGDSDRFLDAFFQTGFSCQRCRCVFRSGQPVAAVYWFDGQWQGKSVVYLYALAVEQESRGQGLSRLLLAEVHGALKAAGYAGAILEPASASLAQYYASFGYRFFGGRRQVDAQAAKLPAAVEYAGVLGYENARRSFLPEGAVMQEGALTAFLQTQCSLCVGDGFVAAVDTDHEAVVEFLGDESRISGLLAAVQLSRATVRLAGGEPASMYLSFTEDTELPSYFGLPLD